MVQMENRRGPSRQDTGSVLVAVEDTRPQMILIRSIPSFVFHSHET